MSETVVDGALKEQILHALHVELLAAKFHDIYQQEAKRQGDVRHKDAYVDLPENIKEFDRVLARYVIENYSQKARPADWRNQADGYNGSL